MIRTMKLAKINLTMQTGTIVRWLKKEGERVERDEPLLEVETDKAVNTVESFYAGYLKKILVPEGQEVPVDTLIAYIGEKDDEVPAEPPAEMPREKAKAPAQAAAKGAAPRGGTLNASPLARRLAAELGVDLSTVTGSGPDGRISKEDVLAASQRGVSAATPAAGTRELPVSGLKKLTGERMKASYLEAPHIYLEVSVQAGALEALRARLNAGAGEAERFTLTDLLVRAVSLALKENPLLNATLRGGKILAFEEQGIGVAVAGPGGLVVPVLRGCQGLSLKQIRDRRRELVARAREGRQSAEDLGGGTFTITNLGMYGVDAFRPILYPGQAAILAVGAVADRPVARNGNLEIGRLMTATLSCDHRIIDGAYAADFLNEFRRLLEHPVELPA